MDQSAFRSLLDGHAPSSASASVSRQRPAVSSGTLGGARQRLGIGATYAGRDQGIPESRPSRSSVEQFRPRQQKSAASKGKAKADDQDTPPEPSYKRYGYADRASMRRAGLDETEDLEVQEERRPRGLDFSKLDPDKRALLGIEPEEIPEEELKDEVLPPKTDEEIEKELAEAEAELNIDGRSHSVIGANGQKADLVAQLEPPPKKQKRSRADMLRDLQAKIAASATAATEVKLNEPTGNQSRSKKQTTAASEPAVIKGFKAIERAPEKKKKRKPKEDVVEASAAYAKGTDPGSGPTTDGPFLSKGATAGVEVQGDIDNDDDIFGGAGDYDDGLSADQASAEEGEETEKASGTAAESSGPTKYFDDQDDIIPKFETWRSPTPPPRPRSRSPEHRKSGDHGQEESTKPQRLEGFSTSQYSARELLDRDNALAREEKRKLRKLKGKDKKEAMERLAELDGSRTAEQKEADRLNRDAQEYENYERKKQKRERTQT